MRPLMRLLLWVLPCATLLAAPSHAQVRVLGVEIGASSLPQVRKRVPQRAAIKAEGINDFFGGPLLATDGAGYGIEGLSEVSYIFDTNQRLSGVAMQLDKSRFDELLGLLATRYKMVRQERAAPGDMFARFKTQGVTIEMGARHHGFDMALVYYRDDLYRRIRAQAAQERQQTQASGQNDF